jgi:chromosome segregation ATPase
VVARGDVAALGSPEQLAQWRRIEALELALATAPRDAETDAMRDRVRLVKGVLQWQLQQDFRGRLYGERRELRALDAALAEMRSRWLRVERANETAPKSTGDFSVRIADLQARLTALRERLAQARESQSGQLASLAIAELDAQKQRLADYEVQARFSLASIYDRAAEPPK